MERWEMGEMIRGWGGIILGNVALVVTALVTIYLLSPNWEGCESKQDAGIESPLLRKSIND